MANPKRLSGRYKFVNAEADDTTQYATPSFQRLSATQRRTLSEIKHVWKTGDRYYKLAATYYGRPELWWAIALYNNKPTEGQIFLGDTIRVPMPIETYLRYL
jgi:nucleoid-associated protein YgaU